jgi:transposase
MIVGSLAGSSFVIRNGLRWRDVPAEYMPSTTIYNRFIRWSRLGVFNKIFAGLAAEGGKPDQLMIDATHLKAHRTVASLLKKDETVRLPVPTAHPSPERAHAPNWER